MGDNDHYRIFTVWGVCETKSSSVPHIYICHLVSSGLIPNVTPQFYTIES